MGGMGMKHEKIYHYNGRPAPVYWCDACAHEDSVFGAACAHCEIHGAIYEPIGCADFKSRKTTNQ